MKYSNSLGNSAPVSFSVMVNQWCREMRHIFAVSVAQRESAKYALKAIKKKWLESKVSFNVRICGVAWIIFSVVAVFHIHLAVAGVPTDQVHATVDRVLTILQEPRLKSADNRKERREQLSKVISARFDFVEMTRRSLGAEWQALLPCSNNSSSSCSPICYAMPISGIWNRTTAKKFCNARETQEDQYAVVETILRSLEGTEYTIDYRLHLIDREWKVYDVVIENVSIVNNYRSQFARVINRSSYDGLIRALREKNLSKGN
jgi:phospholipid transport system substrate-binding protein